MPADKAAVNGALEGADGTQPQLVTIAEIATEAEAAARSLEARIVVADGAITIDGQYDIDLARCRTHEQILAWTLHLSEKRWATMPLLRKVAAIAMDRNGLRYPQMGGASLAGCRQASAERGY